MEAGPGSTHTMSGFTSTSTDKLVARGFSEIHRKHTVTSADTIHNIDRHMLKMSIQKGAGVSISQHSTFNEDEILLNHGSSMVYKETTKEPNHLGGHDYTHHVTTHPQSVPLKKYNNEYKHGSWWDRIKG